MTEVASAPLVSVVGEVGVRTMPSIGAKYYAKTPRPNAFATVWLPVNASNRQVRDASQDVMLLWYNEFMREKQRRAKQQRPPAHFAEEVDFPTLAQQRAAMARAKPKSPPDCQKAAMWMTNINALAPFASLGKPTCGFYFSRETDNKKRQTGIPPTNPVLWRSKASTPL